MNVSEGIFEVNPEKFMWNSQQEFLRKFLKEYQGTLLKKLLVEFQGNLLRNFRRAPGEFLQQSTYLEDFENKS